MFFKRVFFIILLIQSQFLWAQFYSVKHIKINDTLSMRSHPNVDAQKVGELSYNASNFTTIKCQKSNNNRGPKEWCQVTYNTDYRQPYSGWIAQKYIEKSNDSIRQETQYNNKTFKVIHHSPGETLNIRAGMGSKYPIVGELSYNEVGIDILSCQKSKWCWIHYKGNRGADGFGWVYSKYLQVNKEKKVSSPTPTNSTSNSIGTYEVTIAELNVRDNPNKQSNILGVAKKGMKLDVYEFNGKWARTKYGWISGKHLNLIQNNRHATVSQKTKSDNKIIIVDKDEDINVVNMLIIGKGEQCKISMDYVTESTIWTDCSGMTNQANNNYCTDNKTACMTHYDIRNFMHKSITINNKKYIEKFNKKVFDFEDKLMALNYDFLKIQKLSSLDKIDILKDLLIRTYQLSDKYYNTDIYRDIDVDGECFFGTDNLKKHIKKHIHAPGKSLVPDCSGVIKLSLRAQAQFESYNKQAMSIKFGAMEYNAGYETFWLDGCGITNSRGEREKCQLDTRVNILENKILSCKKKLIKIHYSPTDGTVFDINCDQIFKYNAILLKEECKNDIAESCYKYADYINVERNSIEALPYAKKAFFLKKRKLGNNAKEIAKNYNQLGILYIEKGNYSKALKLIQKALSLREKYLDKNSIDMTKSYQALGIFYDTTGNYPQAFKYFKKALTIRKNKLGVTHISVGETLNALGDTYNKIGDYDKALNYLEKALNIREKILGKEHIATTLTYNSIGEVYNSINKYKIALQYFHNALDIRLKMLYYSHIDTIKVYTNLANTYMMMKDYTNAKKYFNKALFLQYSDNDPIFSEIQNGIGTLYMISKEYQDALSYFKRALATQESILGPNHPETSTTYYNIGIAYYEMKKYAKAYEFSKKSFDAFLENRDKNFQVQNNKQKELYLKENSNKIQLLLESASSYIKSNPLKKKSIIQNIFNSWLNYKGSIFDSENAIASLYASTKDKVLKEKIDKLVTYKRYLAKQYQSLPRPKERDSWSQNIKDTEEKIGKLTNEISSKATGFKAQPGLKSISYKDISKNLKGNELYVDYAKVGSHYYVFGLDSKENITFRKIDKKSSKEIDTLIQAFRKDIMSILDDSAITDAKLKQLTVTSKKRLSKLYELVLNKPLLKEFNGKTNLILSPDGALRLLPFETMFDKKNNKYLIEEKEIRYIPSGKELVRLYKYSKTEKIDNQNSNVVVFANPDFNINTSKLPSLKKDEAAITPNTNRAGIIKSLFKMRFSPLPGTKEEAISIKETLVGKADVKEYMQAEANEANLLKVKEPKILHIATHGFFINDNTIPNPMLKSGIALSGANSSAIKGKSDGIVTALKLSGLDLKGTELVVLSACQTGVVDVNSTESVSGLSKAFIQAGAKDIVISLWSVNDQATKDLMSSFYKEMQIQSSYAKALKEAKLKMIKNDMHPFFWAPFIVNGL